MKEKVIEMTRAVAVLHKKADRAAFGQYLRYGRVPLWLAEIVEATKSFEAYWHYSLKQNPNWHQQPRVPKGQEGGGQWTSGGGASGKPSATTKPSPKPASSGVGQYTVEVILNLLEKLPVRGISGKAKLLRRGWELYLEAHKAGKIKFPINFGAYKKRGKWANQIIDRNWPPEEIENIIKTGERFKAPNFINPQNTATRFQGKDPNRIVVLDDATKEVIQISKTENFEPLK